MTLIMLKQMLWWCSLFNIIFFLLSCLIFRLAHAWIFHYHGKWYHISEERFNEIYYTVMMLFKTAILFFNIVPYLALMLIS